MGSGGFAPSGVQGLGPGQRVWGARLDHRKCACFAYIYYVFG